MNSPSRGLREKIVRFGITGAANTILDLCVFALLTSFGVFALIANVLSWSVAVTMSYWVNSRWSFERDVALGDRKSFLRFVGMGAMISLGVSSIFIAALTGLIGLWPAKILGTVVAAMLNFIAARWSIEGRVR